MTYLVMTLQTKDQQLLEACKQLFPQKKDAFFRVYESKMKFEGTEKKAWTYCLIEEIPSEIELNKDALLKKLTPELKSGIIRIELMELTPNSFLQKETTHKKMTIIEHVDVQEDHLKEFQTIMIQNNTPAMKYIIENKNWCYEFIALETDDILYQQAGFKSWNQIHLIDMGILGAFKYKKDFNEGLKAVNAPNFETNFNKLKQIREFTYKYKAKLLNN